VAGAGDHDKPLEQAGRLERVFEYPVSSDRAASLQPIVDEPRLSPGIDAEAVG